MKEADRVQRPPSPPLLRRIVQRAILVRMAYEARATRRRHRKVDKLVTFADLSPTLGRWNRLRVRGRLVTVEKLEPRHEVTPFQDVGAGFLPEREVEVTLLDSSGRPASKRFATRTDRFGFFDAVVAMLQPVPRRTRLTARTLVEGQLLAGTGECFVLPDDDRGPVLVSDIDKTYLESLIRSPRDIVRMLAGPGNVRRPLPGMPALTASLTKWPARVPLVFLSGTPFFFKRSLEDRFYRDGLEPAGLYLRPPTPTIEEQFSTAELGRFLESLHYQFGFKVLTILQILDDLPDRVELLLWGDDNQHDPHVYATVSGWLEGALVADQVLALADRYKTLPAHRAELARMIARPPRGHRVRQIAIREVTARPASWPEELLDRAAPYETAEDLSAILADAGLGST